MRKLLYTLILCPFIALADVAVEGTPVLTPVGSADTSFIVNLSSGAQTGEVQFIWFYSNDTNRYVTASGWTEVHANASGGDGGTMGFTWREVTDGNKAETTEDFTINSGSASFKFYAARLSGVDITALNASQNYDISNVGSSVSTFNIAANTITGVDAGSAIAVGIGTEASRDVSSADADLSLVGNSGTAVVTLHAYIDPVSGSTGNPQYDFTMSGSRDYGLSIIEIPAAGGSASIVPILQNHARRRRQ